MNSFKINRKILIGILLAAIAVMVFVIYANWSSAPSFCTSREIIDSSVTVQAVSGRIYYGLNADRDALKFGAVSPGTEVRRSIIAQYSKDAMVTVRMLGNIAPWAIIEPRQFYLPAQAQQEVHFTLLVPGWAKNGNYTGKAEFCFVE